MALNKFSFASSGKQLGGSSIHMGLWDVPKSDLAEGGSFAASAGASDLRDGPLFLKSAWLKLE
jgi:hypothetical protein